MMKQDEYESEKDEHDQNGSSLFPPTLYFLRSFIFPGGENKASPTKKNERGNKWVKEREHFYFIILM